MVYGDSAGKRLEVLLTGLCDRHRLEVPAAGDDGGYRLMYDDDRWLTCFEYGGGQAVVSASLGRLAESGPEREEALLQALNCNLRAMKSRHEIVGLDEDNAVLCLFCKFDLEGATIDSFEQIIEKFLDRLDAVQKTIRPEMIDGRRHADGNEAVLPFNLV